MKNFWPHRSNAKGFSIQNLARKYRSKISSVSSNEISNQLLDDKNLISIKEDLEILTNDCEELLEKGVRHPGDIQLKNNIIEQNLKQLRELRRYSEQIETALDLYLWYQQLLRNYLQTSNYLIDLAAL